MDSWLARDVAALRLELGKRTGDTGQLIAANLRMFAGLVEAELCDGESKPDLRGVEVATSDVVKRYRLESVITPENERSVSAHVRKKLSGEMDRY